MRTHNKFKPGKYLKMLFDESFLERVNVQLPDLKKSAEGYLEEREVTGNDVLLNVHACMTPMPRLRAESERHLSKISALNLAFRDMGGGIYEIVLAKQYPRISDFLSRAGEMIEHERVFVTPEAYPVMNPALEKDIISQMKGALSHDGRVLISGSYLFDYGFNDGDPLHGYRTEADPLLETDIPTGHVGSWWITLNMKKVPSYILQAYCFQKHPGDQDSPVQRSTVNKEYQGCI